MKKVFSVSILFLFLFCLLTGCGLLGDLALGVRGQQFGTDGGVQNVHQYVLGGGEIRGIGDGFDDPADQGLGDGAVDAVHAHMVAVVGRPAERQLGQVAGADDHAALETDVPLGLHDLGDHFRSHFHIRKCPIQMRKQFFHQITDYRGILLHNHTYGYWRFSKLFSIPVTIAEVRNDNDYL